MATLKTPLTFYINYHDSRHVLQKLYIYSSLCNKGTTVSSELLDGFAPKILFDINLKFFYESFLIITKAKSKAFFKYLELKSYFILKPKFDSFYQ